MSIKLKALGLGLIAMLAMGAFAVVNAGATTSGHFIFGSHHTFVTGHVGAEHKLHFVSSDGSQIGCDVQQYTGTHVNSAGTPTTTTSLTIVPKWEQCYTTSDPNVKFDVDENGCHLLFTSRATPAVLDATAHVVCPAGKSIVITHQNCEITVRPQTVGGAAGNGITYTNNGAPGEEWITLHSTKVKVASEYHGGLCIFLGTNQTATMEGSVTVTGFSDANHTKRTDLTAT